MADSGQTQVDTTNKMLGRAARYRFRRAIAHLPAVIGQTESLEAIRSVTYEGTTRLLVLTDQRIVAIDRKKPRGLALDLPLLDIAMARSEATANSVVLWTNRHEKVEIVCQTAEQRLSLVRDIRSRLNTQVKPENDATLATKRTDLEDRLDELKADQRRRRVIGKVALIFGGALLFLSPVMLFVGPMTAGLIAVYGVGFLLVAYLFSPSEMAADIQGVENELELLSIGRQSVEQGAYRIFKLHQLELKKYYDQTLSQARTVFVVGIGCILMGFAVIAGALYVIGYRVEEGETSEKLILAAVGSVGAILSNFVAAMYLKMQADSVRSLTEFHSRLVMTHHLHFGNFLAANIRDEDLREATLGAMAAAMATRSAGERDDGVSARPPGTEHE